VTSQHAVRLRDVVPLVLAFAAIAAVAVLNGERKAQTPITYSTYDAAPGGYRAWYELLQLEGIPATRFDERPAFLDASVGTIVLAGEAGPAAVGDFGEADAGALADWVRRGGRVIVLGSAGPVNQARTALRLPEAMMRDGASAGHPSIAPELLAAGVRRVPAVGPLRLRARQTDRVLVADRDGRLIVSYPLGRGTVIDAIDAAALANDQIAVPDRARLAVALARIPAPRGAFAFDESVHGYLAPVHWWTALPPRLVAAIVGALIVVALALAGAAWRLGPPLGPVPLEAPATASYLDALATLYERARARRKALAEARRSSVRLVARSLGRSDDAAAVGDAAGAVAPRERAALADLEALSQRAAPTDAELVRGLELAVALRKEVGAYGRGD
jgi:Domain of unknown function (DUF4350)